VKRSHSPAAVLPEPPESEILDVGDDLRALAGAAPRTSRAPCAAGTNEAGSIAFAMQRSASGLATAILDARSTLPCQFDPTTHAKRVAVPTRSLDMRRGSLCHHGQAPARRFARCTAPLGSRISIIGAVTT